ncbi:fasciclin domain-containing protein [Phyllosticta citrichinensis]|uniref:Fasciclin domain-containing protein n=1 Tax=Phyllosticta citrichinensis TaxID=1130410 RepID=A0ABR1XWF5_9PEZI
MHFKNILLAAFASVASVHAQTIIDVLNNTPELSTLKSLINQFPDLVDTLSRATDITVVAPSNEAFTNFLNENPGADQNKDLVKNLLTYHVISGTFDAAAITGSPGPIFPTTLLTDPEYTLVSGGQRVKGAAEGGGVVFTSGLLKTSTVTQADVRFEGGVAHVVEAVLTFPAITSETASAAGLTQLVGALKTANLVDFFDTTPDITVFAPNDDAFNAIASTVSGLSPQDLVNILTYHVVAGTVAFSTSLSDGQQIPTLNGASVTVHKEGNTVRINDATVVTADVLLKGGVAHVIDLVLQPSSGGGRRGGQRRGGQRRKKSKGGSCDGVHPCAV